MKSMYDSSAFGAGFKSIAHTHTPTHTPNAVPHSHIDRKIIVWILRNQNKIVVFLILIEMCGWLRNKVIFPVK